MRQSRKEHLENLAELAWKSYGLSEPLDVKALAKKLQIMHDEVVLSPTFFGLTIPLGYGWHWVLINRRHPEVVQRFTWCEEIAHVMLGHTPYLMVSPRAAIGESTQEREARYMAGCLLAPASRVRRAVKMHGLDVDKLARHFGMSRTAMRVRLEQLGYAIDAWAVF